MRTKAGWIMPVLLCIGIITTAQDKLTLTGTIKGLKEGARVWLTDANNPIDTLAKAKVKKGSFVLKAVLNEPKLVSLQLGGGKSVMTFLDNQTVRMTGSAAALKQLKVTGSSTYTDFRDFQKTFDPLFERLTRASQPFQMGMGNDSLRRVMNAIRDSLQGQVDVFINKRRSSPVSAFLVAITMQLTEDISVTEKRLNLIKQPALENMYGIYVKETVAETKLTAVGSQAMEFSQADTSGVQVSLSSFRGKYVLVDFWASWCGPCRQENPNVVASYQKFKDKNFTILGVSLDRPGQKERWLQAIYADNLTWTHVSDLQYFNNAVAVQYKIQSIPQNFLVGPDGKIVAKNLRGPYLEQKLCEILGCN